MLIFGHFWIFLLFADEMLVYSWRTTGLCAFQEMVKSSVAKEKLAPPDPHTAGDWRKLASLMKQLPKRCNNFVHEESEVASFLEAAAQCVGSFVDDLQISYIRLTAANSLLDLAAALICDELGELAPIMTTSIATPLCVEYRGTADGIFDIERIEHCGLAESGAGANCRAFDQILCAFGRPLYQEQPA